MGDKKNNNKMKYVYLISACVTLLFLGLMYAFSMFTASISEYINIPKENITPVYNINLVFFCLGAILGSWINKKFGIRVTMVLCGVFFAVGFLGVAWLCHESIVALYILYGVLCGTGVGIGYNCLLSTVNAWFFDRIGFSSGLMLMIFGCGPLVLGPVLTNLVAAINLPVVFSAISIIVFCLCLIVGAELKRSPNDTYAQIKKKDESLKAENIKFFKSPILYVYYVWAALFILMCTSTNGSCASDAALCGVDASIIAVVVGLFSFFNGLSRLATGFIIDKLGLRFTVVYQSILSVLAMGIIFAGIMLKNPVLYIIGACLAGFLYGICPVFGSCITKEHFGQKNYSFKLSIVNLVMVFGSLFAMLLDAVVGISNRQSVFMALLILAVCACLLAIPVFVMLGKSNKSK